MSFYDDVRNFLGDLETQQVRTEKETRAYCLLRQIKPVLSKALDENKVLSSEIALMRLRNDGSEEIACLRKENEELKNQLVSLLARRVEALEARLDASHWLGPSPRKFGVDPYPWERLFGNSTCDPLPPTPKTFCGPSSGTEPASDPEAKAYYTETR